MLNSLIISTVRSNKTKEEIFRDGFTLFVNKPLPDKLLINYLNDENGLATSSLQMWLVDNMKTELIDWCTGIGIIEAVEHLYEAALENGNINEE